MKWILENSKVVLVLLVLVTVVGVLTFIQLPQREIPEISVNVVTIKTVYPGASPEEVERNITKPIEEKLKNLDDLDEISSISAFNFSNIVLTFKDSVDETLTYSELRQYVSDVAKTFPEQAFEPEVNTEIQPTAIASYQFLSYDRSELLEIRPLIEKWEEEFKGISGVTKVIIKGLPEEEIKITLDPEKLKSANILAPQVIQAINQEFTSISLGSEQLNNMNYQLDLKNYSQVTEIENVTVGKGFYQNPVYVRDLGTVRLQPKEYQDLVTYKGIPALSFTILVEKGSNIPDIQEDITKKIEQIKSELPDQVNVETFYQQSNQIQEIFSDLFVSLLVSIIVVMIIMFLGLSFSAAVIVTFSIPISILLGLIPLPYVGVDLNQISMIGMIIAIGILVDDAIVVNENIQRQLVMGRKGVDAVIKGVQEVRTSIITSSLMIIFSFFPLLFLSGASGDFIRGLPTIVITSIVGSTIMALTMIPIFQSWRAGRVHSEVNVEKERGIDKVFRFIEAFYVDKLLSTLIKRPVFYSIVGIICCVILSMSASKLPFEFFPEADREEAWITVQYPSSTLLETTFEKMKEIEQVIQEDPTIKETAIFTGTGLPGLFGSTLSNPGDNVGQVLVRIDKDQLTTGDWIEKWEQKLRKMYPDVTIEFDTIVSGPPVGAPVAVKIAGPNIDELLALSDELKSRLETLPGNKYVTVDIGTPQPMLEYNPNRSNMDWYGVTITDINNLLRMANEGMKIGELDDGNNRRDLKLFIGHEDKQTDLKDLELITNSGNKLTLDYFVKATEKESIKQIPHLDGVRTVTVRGYPLAEEKAAFESSAFEIVENLKKSLDSDYVLSIGGETSERSDFFIEVSKIFIIVMFLIYLVVVFQFKSLSVPFLILSSVYLAVTGAIIGLVITQTPLSFLGVLGMVSLAGIVVRNSILLIEFIEERMKAGISIQEAILETGRARVRPVILTTLTSIGALIPVAVAGDVLFKPLAISIISGLAFSTGLTLALIPVFYLSLYKIRNRKKRKSSEEMV